MARELTAELIVDAAIPEDPRLSPDGRSVAYVVSPAGRTEEHPTGAIWVAAVDGLTPPRRLTAGGAHDRAPRWAPDGRTLFFLSDRVERGKTQLYRIALDGGEAERLTEWTAGLAGFVPLPDGKRVALWAKDEPTAEDERRERERDDARVWGERVPVARLRLLDLATGTVRTLDAIADLHVAEVAPHPRDGSLAVLAWPTPELDRGMLGAAIDLVDPDTGTHRRLAATPVAWGSLVWRAAGDGWHLAYVGQLPPPLVGGAAVFDLPVPAAGEATPRPLTADLPACPYALVAAPEGEALALVAEGVTTALYRFDRDGGHPVRLSGEWGGMAAASVALDGAVVAALISPRNEGLNVWTGSPAGPLRRLTDLRPDLREVALGAQEVVHWTAADGLALDGLLITPPGRTRADAPFPLVTLVHGGPYGRFADQLQLGPLPSGQWLTTAGYAVFLPNPRGGMGHGHAFAVAVAGAVGCEDWGDVVAGIDHLVAAGVADPDRLAIGGWSQGGFMSAWAVGQTDRFKAAVVGAGPTDWGMMVATSDLMHFEAALGGSYGWEGVGPHPHDAISPISYAHRVRTPVLILHGEKDERVPVSQAEYFARALRELGVPNEYVVYPREPHGIRERNHQLDLLRRVRDWYARWLGGGDMAPGTADAVSRRDGSMVSQEDR